MKKLMIAAAIVCAAAFAQAATVSWGAQGITEGTTLVNGKAYLFTADTYNRTAVGEAIQAAYAAGTLATFLETYAVTDTTVSSGVIDVSGLDPADLGIGTGTGNKHTFYSVVFDTTSTISGDTNFFVSKNLANKYVPTGDGTLGLSFGNLATASTADGAWTAVAVPEPTSGLLLLLGIAGLALKRRRA